MADKLISRQVVLDAFRSYMVEHHDREKCISAENCETCEIGCLWRKVVAAVPSVNAVVLPCKVGDTVYTPQDFSPEYLPFVDSGKVFAIGIDEHNTMWVSVRYDSGLKYYHTADDIGKTVFLTREEAEKELGERKEENPCDHCMSGSYRGCDGCGYGERKENATD